MNNALHKIAFVTGIGLLAVSIFWSQDGFNFDLAGDSGYGDLALAIGYFLAFAVTVMEFVFSTKFRELNASLITFGVLAYVYSIYTNAHGIMHFQGGDQSKAGAWILGAVMDGIPEPLIAWSLGESLSGDFVGNLIKSFMQPFNGNNNDNSGKSSFHSETKQEKPKASPFPMSFGDNLPKREESDDTQPKIHGVKTHRVGYDGKNRSNRH